MAGGRQGVYSVVRGGEFSVSGQGGVWIRDLWITPYRIPLHDLVGSFRFVGDRLQLAKTCRAPLSACQRLEGAGPEPR